jgi:hypothetical protein
METRSYTLSEVGSNWTGSLNTAETIDPVVTICVQIHVKDALKEARRALRSVSPRESKGLRKHLNSLPTISEFRKPYENLLERGADIRMLPVFDYTSRKELENALYLAQSEAERFYGDFSLGFASVPGRISGEMEKISREKPIVAAKLARSLSKLNSEYLSFSEHLQEASTNYDPFPNRVLVILPR